MKIRKFGIYFIGLAAMVAFMGCQNSGLTSGSGKASSKTGWKYNDIKSGGFEYIANYKQAPGPGLVFVEGGTYTMGRVADDVRFDWNNIPRRVTVSSFYMDENEVTNTDYREYLYWLKRVFAEYPQVYKDALPDTLVWRGAMAFNEPMVEYYFRHPAYNDYPVVGVSWLQATRYCDWRTDRVNEMMLIKNGVLRFDPNQRGANNFNTEAYLAGQYEGVVRQDLPSLDPNQPTRKARMEDGFFYPKYRLPTEAEWEFAALGMAAEMEIISDKQMYPWKGNYTRSDERKNKGRMVANFARGRGDYMGVSGSLNDAFPYTSPVRTFPPNQYGLYDMAGNVSEWVLDVYRPLSSLDVDELSPFRGNVFTVQVRDADENLVEKDSLGQIPRRVMTAEENLARMNYKRSDNRNYRDGDVQSSLQYNTGDRDNSKSTSAMYYQGREGDQVGITSLISDRSRVYKGGSWRDRAYWMIPGTRRFLDEDKATDDIGFRCAMSRLGSATGK
ncbi:MAG: gliding motility lipoprotein GldJ [Bacteroidales bacterium]